MATDSVIASLAHALISAYEILLAELRRGIEQYQKN